jgi:hypothetical protein
MEIIQERPKIVGNNPCIPKQLGYYRSMTETKSTKAGERTRKYSVTVVGNDTFRRVVRIDDEAGVSVEQIKAEAIRICEPSTIEQLSVKKVEVIGQRTRKTLAERLVGAVFEGDSSAFKPKEEKQPAMTDAKFISDKEDVQLISKIAARAVMAAKNAGIEYDHLTALMDIEACHCNGTPLRLTALLKADDATFGHDVFGIRRFIDRSTGKLGGCFVPRLAQQKSE